MSEADEMREWLARFVPAAAEGQSPDEALERVTDFMNGTDLDSSIEGMARFPGRDRAAS